MCSDIGRYCYIVRITSLPLDKVLCSPLGNNEPLPCSRGYTVVGLSCVIGQVVASVIMENL